MNKMPLWYYISFPMTKTLMFADLMPIQEELHERGVGFDTGYLFGEKPVRDWQLDFSLSGPMTGPDIIEFLNEKGVEFEVQEVTPSGSWSYNAENKTWHLNDEEE